MNDRELEKLLSASAVKQVRTLCESTPSDEDLKNIIPSDHFTQTMETMIAESEKRQQQIRGRKRFGKIVASLIIIVALSVGGFATAKANHESFFQWFDRSFNITGQQDQGWDTEFNIQIKNNVHNVYLPSWMPEGFKAIESTQTEGTCFITYKSTDKTIRFVQYAKSENVLNDNEINAMEKFSIDGQQYYYGEKLNASAATRKLIWKTETNTFTLTSNIGKEDLIRVAENLKFKES